MSNDDTILWMGIPQSSEGGNRLADGPSVKATETTHVQSDQPENLEAARLLGVVPELSGQERVSDDRLMAAVTKGDCTAFAQLYDRHVRKCFGLALRVVQEPSIAEDVVQEVFAKLWSRPDTFSPERGQFNTWILMVVRNKALDNLRRAKTRSEIHIVPLHVESTGLETVLDMVPDAGPTPHEQAWENETATVVRHALGQLTADQYETITLAYFGGLTQREIADKLQQPLGTVKTRTRSALQRLHRLLASNDALSE